MTVIIGIDPHKASHTAVAIGCDEHALGQIRVRATCQTDREAVGLGRAARATDLGGRVRRRDGLSAVPAAGHAGEDVLDVPATLASRIRVLGDRAVQQERPERRAVGRPSPLCGHPGSDRCGWPTTARSCGCWPSATTRSGGCATTSSPGSTPLSPNLSPGGIAKELNASDAIALLDGFEPITPVGADPL